MILGVSAPFEIAKMQKFKAASMPLKGKSDEEINECRRRFDRAGVRGVQYAAYCNLTSVNERVRQRAIQSLKQSLVTAHKAGCEAVVTGGGHRNPDDPEAVYAIHRDNWSELALDVLAESCKQVLSDISIGETRLCLETWVMTPLDSFESVKYVLDKVNHPNLKICFDPVNLMNLDRYFSNGEYILKCLDAFGDDIHVVHLKDTRLLPKPHTYHMSEALIGDGNLDFNTLLKGCSQLQSDLPLLIEHVKDAELIKQSAAKIRWIAEKLKLALD